MVENLQRQAYYAFGVTAKTRFGWGETASVDVYTMENRSKDLIHYCNQCYNVNTCTNFPFIWLSLDFVTSVLKFVKLQ